MEIFGILALIFSAVAAIGSGISSHLSQRSANSFNNQQYEDWKAYNTPSAQMERLGEAGLNPYMVSGVNNTLSQPFAIGQNTGISELLQGMSQAASGGANFSIQQQNATTAKTNAQTKQTEASIHQMLAELREDMVKLAKEKHDPLMALYWGQANAQQIGNQILSRSADDIVNLRHYTYLRAKQAFDFDELMNPLQLQYYEPMQRARINDLLASASYRRKMASHLDYMENYMTQQFLHNQSMDYRNYYEGKRRFDLNYDLDYTNKNRRLELSRDYFNLAKWKFYKDIATDVLDYGLKFRGPSKLLRTTKSGAGKLNEWTEYEYGF